jgi:1-acyl-sn-glycerol-3-phosphate acyltransferase
MSRFGAGLLRLVYGIYALPVFAALLVLATALALLLPGLKLRRRVTRSFARLGLAVLLIRLRVDGLSRLPGGSCVVVANHSSYLDGIVMKAALPPRFSFVIKQEARAAPLLGFLLRRIGSEFVDRSSQQGRQRDARRMMRRAAEGHSLVFFPEGTFATEPGLKRFHTGAFATAARAGVPVVPSIIHGARRALPNRAVVPRPGVISVEILDPLAPADHGASAEALRDAARRQIAARLDEPDLLHP